MKTIGEILRSARLEKNISLTELSSLTRIDVRHIEALEDNNFKKLPGATFTKGFVRNLSLALGKDPEESLALLRRDYQGGVLTDKLLPVRRSRRFSLASLFQSQLSLLLVGAVVFLTYLAFQYRAVITPPPLEITSPTRDAVLTSPIFIEGKTASGSVVTINDELKLTPDQEGNFQTKINLDNGQREVRLSVSNRFGRTTSKTIPITIVSSQ